MTFYAGLLRLTRDMNFAKASNGAKKFCFSGFSSSARQQFKRSFHGGPKRPKVSAFSTKWNVYDELKLFSYSSHLAFFMLLPPIIQMYTTKVEVTRDDTLSESSFECVQSQEGIVLPRMTFLDIINTEKKKLMELCLNRDAASHDNKREGELASGTLHSFGKASFEKNIDSSQCAFTAAASDDDEFKAYLVKLDGAYRSLKQNSISPREYCSQVEAVTDSLMGLAARRRQSTEYVNNAIMGIFDQLHRLKLHEHESALFQRLLSAYKQPEIKYLNIRQKILSRYEVAKSIRSKSKKQTRALHSKLINVPLYKMMESSKWLHDYLQSFERFSQLIQLFAVTNQSNKSFNTLLNIGLSRGDVREKVTDPQLRYGLVSLLRESNNNKEALLLEKRMRRVINCT